MREIPFTKEPKEQAANCLFVVNLSGKVTVSGHNSEKLEILPAPEEQIHAGHGGISQVK
jgi:hypothetical protein